MAGVGGAWAIYLICLFAGGAQQLDPVLHLVILAKFVVSSVAVLLERVSRRIQDVICGGQPQAVQLGRRLEMIRRDPAGATVLPFPRPRPGSGGVGV